MSFHPGTGFQEHRNPEFDYFDVGGDPIQLVFSFGGDGDKPSIGNMCLATIAFMYDKQLVLRSVTEDAGDLTHSEMNGTEEDLSEYTEKFDFSW
jgi:hypothetical protein